MSLSKQLFMIISFIFFMILAGTYLISLNNTKEYLQSEATIKAKDTATSLGMVLKNYINDKSSPQIESTILAISNSGFYKSIKLVDSYYTISDSMLIKSSRKLNKGIWEISNLKVNTLGKIERIFSDEDLSKELEALENGNSLSSESYDLSENIYIFVPNKNYNENKEVTFTFTAKNQYGKVLNVSSTIKLSKTIYEVNRTEKFDYVPSWFINLVKIDLQEQSSEISDGWKTTAIIYVTANAGEAYAKLYEQAKNAIIYSLLTFLISIVILYFFVQRLLKPLKNIEKLAKSISIGKFKKIDELPDTTEIKSVAIAMNDMSGKIESIISKLNKNIEKMTHKLSKDELTNLYLEQGFDADIKNMFIHKDEGYVFIVKIFDLASFAKERSSKDVNNFIKKFAKVLSDTKLEKKTDIFTYRFFGSQFAIIAKNFNYDDANILVEKLKKSYEELSIEFDKDDIVHIGATPFSSLLSKEEIKASALEAYEKASLIGPNEAYIQDSSAIARDMKVWKNLILDIIDNKKFKVNYVNDSYSLKTNNLVMQEAFTCAFDDDGNEIPIGTFISISERFDKLVDFDKAVILTILDDIKSRKIKHKISINLTLESISDTSFIFWLEKLIRENKQISSSLVFSVSAYGVTKNIDKFKFFAKKMHQCNVEVIIKRFEPKFIPLENLKDFNLDYIRLAREYTRNISNDISKQSFIESICELASLLNIKIYAEAVLEDVDKEELKKYNIFASS